MPFFKRDGEQILQGERVTGPGFELRAEDKDTYQYPVNDWHWFDNLDAALASGVFATAEKVSRRQLLRALEHFGKLTDIEAFVATQPRAVQIDWNEAGEFERSHPQLNGMAQLLGMSGAEVDQVFAYAKTIV